MDDGVTISKMHDSELAAGDRRAARAPAADAPSSG